MHGPRRRTIGRLARRALAQPAVPILVMASIAQAVRADWLNVAVFAAGAAIIAWDARRADRPPGALRPLTARQRATMLAVAAAGGVAAGLVGQRSPWLHAGFGAVGLAVAVVVLGPPTVPPARQPMPAAPVPADTRSGRPWLALLLALALVELGAFASQSDPQTTNPDAPTLSSAVEPLLSGGVARGVLVGLWVLAGWWLVRRVRAGVHE